MIEPVLRYVNSAEYADDFRRVRDAWATPRVLGGAGMFIFTTYATLPSLTRVGSVDGAEALMLRKVAGVGREKSFLKHVLGIDVEDTELAGGLASPAVRSTLTGLGDRHRSFDGMRAEYVDFFAGVITISCLRIRSVLGLPLDAAGCHRYWRYMRHSFTLLGAELGRQRETSDSCAEFVARNAGLGPRTAGYVRHLFASYPVHMATCASTLFPETRRAVTQAMTEPLPEGPR